MIQLKYTVLLAAFIFTFSSCTKKEEFTFLDMENPESASSLNWGLSTATSGDAPQIIAKWNEAKSPDAEAQFLQFYSDEKCSAQMGDEIKLPVSANTYTLPVNQDHLGPFTFKLRTLDKNGNTNLSACSKPYKVFEPGVFAPINFCAAPAESEDKIAEFPLPYINPDLPFIQYSKITIVDSETNVQYDAASILNEQRKFSMRVPRSKVSDLATTPSGTLIGKRNVKITYLLNTGYQFEENKVIEIDGKSPKVSLVIDPVYATKFYSQSCNMLERAAGTCLDSIPIELKEDTSIPADQKGCSKLADAPFQLSFIDSTDIEIEKEAKHFSERSRLVKWIFPDYKRVRIKVTVKSNLGVEYDLLSEGLFNSGYQYIAGKGFDGEGGPAKDAKLTNPIELVYNTKSNYYCFFENASKKIRCSQPGGKLYTVAGNGAIGSEKLINAALTGADISKVSLGKVTSMQFIGDDLYFISEDSIIRKMSLQIDSEGRVKAKEGARLEAITPYFHVDNNIKFKCKNYSIPGVCQLNQEFDKIPAAMSLLMNGFYYEPNNPAEDAYFNKNIIYMIAQKQLYKYDILNNVLEPVLGISKFEKADGDGPQYLNGVVAHSGLELYFARSVVRGPKNSLIINTVKQDGVNKGSHNVIYLNLEGAPASFSEAQALNSDGVRAPYARHLFISNTDAYLGKPNYFPAWPIYSNYIKDFKGGTLVVSQSNPVNRLVVPFNENTALPIDIKQCQGCRFAIKHTDDKGWEELMGQNFYMAIRSVSNSVIHILGSLRETSEIVEHRLLSGSNSTEPQVVNTYNILAGKTYSLLASGSSVASSDILLDRPNYVSMDRKRNHIYFMDGAGQDIKKLDVASKQISSFYGVKNFRDSSVEKPGYNNNNHIMTYREKDESILFAFHVSSNKLYKKSIHNLDHSVLPGIVLNKIQESYNGKSQAESVVPDGASSYSSLYGKLEGTSSLFTSADGSLFFKDFRYTSPRNANLYKIIPCAEANNKDHSCVAINDNVGKSYILASNMEDSLFAKVVGSFFPTDVTIGINHGFALDKDENIYLYDQTNVYLANHKFNTVRSIINIPDSTISQITVGDLDGGKKKVLYVMASRKDARSLEEVYESAPVGQDHLFQEGLAKYYLYSAVLKENGADVSVPVLKLETDFGDGSLQLPNEMLVDNDGNVIISEMGANRILKYFVSK